VEFILENQFVIYTDLMGTLWLGVVEEACEQFVCIKDYDMIKRSRCYKAHESLCDKELLGYKYHELTRNRSNIKFNLEPF
jgi:hypothetical protein